MQKISGDAVSLIVRPFIIRNDVKIDLSIEGYFTFVEDGHKDTSYFTIGYDFLQGDRIGIELKTNSDTGVFKVGLFGSWINIVELEETVRRAGDNIMTTFNLAALLAVIDGTPEPRRVVRFESPTRLYWDDETTRYSLSAEDIVRQISGSPAEGNFIQYVNAETLRWAGIDISGKQDSITGGASSITSNDLRPAHALVSNNEGKVTTSAITAEELGYLDGVSSAIQEQLNAREQRVLLDEDVSHNTYNKINLLHEDAYLTERKLDAAHPSPPRGTFAVYSAPGFEGVVDVLPDITSVSTGEWVYHTRSHHAVIADIDIGSSTNYWNDTDINALITGNYIGEFASSSLAITHVTQNGDVYYNTDLRVLEQVSGFIPEGATPTYAYNYKKLLTSKDLLNIHDILDDIPDWVTGPGDIPEDKIPDTLHPDPYIVATPDTFDRSSAAERDIIVQTFNIRDSLGVARVVARLAGLTLGTQSVESNGVYTFTISTTNAANIIRRPSATAELQLELRDSSNQFIDTLNTFITVG